MSKTLAHLSSSQTHEEFGGKFLGFLDYSVTNTATNGSGAPTSGYGKGGLLVNLGTDIGNSGVAQKIAINTGTEQACVWAEIVFAG